MKVLFAASECAPLVKIGGLADVVGGLPKALKKLGLDVAIAIPKYESIQITDNSKQKTMEQWNNLTITVDYAGKQENVLVYQTLLPDTDIPVYLFENARYLSTGPAYSAKSAEGTILDIDRFSFFSKAVVEFISSVIPDLIPAYAGTNPSNNNIDSRLRGNDNITHFDVIHCHDWHTAWIPLLLKQAWQRPDLSQESAKRRSGLKKGVKTLLTIHNMGKVYQGRTRGEIVEKLGISSTVIASPEGAWQSQSLKKIASSSSTPRNDNQTEVNILLQGIINADQINTVSQTYAREIQTEEYGEDLNDILIKYKNKLTGILNGIDYEVWNPETDKNLVVNYSSNLTNLSNLTNWKEGKKINKTRLLTKVGLSQGENIPTFGMVTRIAEQKGFDILIPALEKLFSTSDAKVIILGVGDAKVENKISSLELKYTDKLRFITRFDDVLAHLIYAGSDFFLVPSRFEPSGLTQLVAMRYGTLPIVRKTGGLADSVEDGVTGFVFEEYSSEALLSKIDQALAVYRTPYTVYSQMVETAMQKDFSWDKSGQEYLKLYERLLT